MISSSLITIELLYYYLYLVKYFKGQYLITSTDILMNIIWLILTNQGLHEGTHQLVDITRNIFSSFDFNPTLETIVAFLDISKAFDKVWHKG